MGAIAAPYSELTAQHSSTTTATNAKIAGSDGTRTHPRPWIGAKKDAVLTHLTMVTGSAPCASGRAGRAAEQAQAVPAAARRRLPVTPVSRRDGGSI